MMWDKKVVKIIEEFIGKYLVSCSFKSVEDDFLWAFASACR